MARETAVASLNFGKAAAKALAAGDVDGATKLAEAQSRCTNDWVRLVGLPLPARLKTVDPLRPVIDLDEGPPEAEIVAELRRHVAARGK